MPVFYTGLKMTVWVPNITDIAVIVLTAIYPPLQNEHFFDDGL